MSRPSEPLSRAIEATAEALHRMGGMECGPDADDYDDGAEHDMNARDLLGNLRAHGWDLVRACGDPLGLCLYVGPHEGDHKVATDEIAAAIRADRQEATDAR